MRAHFGFALAALAISAWAGEQQEVTAKVASPAVPGAIVCQNHDAVMLAIRLYEGWWESQMRAAILGKERDELLHGPARGEPNLKRFGCTLVPAGTKMWWNGEWVPPSVSGTLADGSAFRGVTTGAMVKVGPECRTEVDFTDYRAGLSTSGKLVQKCE